MNNMSMNQTLDIWSELWEAYYGKNGFGSYTAEIYAHTLMPHNPTLHLNGESFKETTKESGLRAARSLYSLLTKFSEENKCQIEIDGRKLNKWFLKKPFLHRCHVKISR